MGSASFHVDDPDAPAPNQPRRAGATVALLSPDRSGVLLEHRADSELWGLIGGSMDDDESIGECARREVWEETGLQLGALELLGIYSNPTRICAYPDGHAFQSLSIAFIGVLPNAEFRISAESRAVEVVAWERIAGLSVPATHRQILTDAHAWASGAARGPFVR